MSGFYPSLFGSPTFKRIKLSNFNNVSLLSSTFLVSYYILPECLNAPGDCMQAAYTFFYCSG